MELELQKRAEELALSDRQKDEFIALLAHELRNPLAPIRNGLQIMAMSNDKADVLASVRGMMDRQLNHMVRLIDDLLDVSRMNRNKLFLQKTRISLAEAMTHAVEATRPALQSAHHELILELPSEEIQLEADLTRLAQVFGNLLSNSIKYTEPGGRIWFSAELNPGEVTVSVRDSGIGIPTSDLANIFDMFSQIHTKGRANTGLGIGLALVRNLVELHEGRITVTSDGAGCGSCFNVHLPLGNVAVAMSEVEETPAQLVPQNIRILVADDNRDACTSLAMLLEIMGNQVQTAYDGQMAIHIAEAFRPQLILMDIGMPSLDGYEATRRIRAHGWAEHTRIVALTGWGQDHDRRRSQMAGCSGHLVKPVSRADLENILRQIPF
ncbi:MAG: ATP-binding protein [Cellvibrionaceae bacterium]|nr:ATP-binding protein [Cellvibrionaceae bacterium]